MANAGRRNTVHHSSQSSVHSSQASSRYAGKSKRTVAFDPKFEKAALKKPTVQVLLDGEDVTPRSLIEGDLISPSKGSGKTSVNYNDSTSIGPPTDLLNQSMFGGSTYQTSYGAGFSKSIMSSMISSRASLDSVTDEISEPVSSKTQEGIQEKINQTGTETLESLTDLDLEKIVNITLEETDTITLLDMPGVSVSTNDSSAASIEEANKRYDQLVANRQGNDRYAERGMQTFDNASKAKEIQTLKVDVEDKGCWATNWDIYDTYNEKQIVEEDDDGDDDLLTFTTNSKTDKKRDTLKPTPSTLTLSMLSQNMSGTQNFSGSVISESSTFSNSTMLIEESDEGSVAAAVNAAADVSNAQMEKIIKLDSFRENLFIMERTIVQNLYHSKQAAYRGLTCAELFSVDDVLDVEVDEASKCPSFERLWSYESNLTKGMAVTCMVWNKENPDLLAVGYNKNGFAENGKGLVCVWSISNPEHPERVYVPVSAVSAIDFSRSRPYLLAVGLFNGTIIMYNVQTAADKPVLDSVDSPGKHFLPIWQLKWVEKEKGNGEDRGEVLISSSGDARVIQWTISKGFEYSDLMKLKRISNTLQPNTKKANQKKDNQDIKISRYTSGMCFDFHPVDGNVYIAGTEDGHVHRCSCSYNEQYLETYVGHRGPVYKASFSPFNVNLFLTCSADWSICLWHIDKTNPVLVFQSGTHPIIDIDWSPMSSVIFAACTEQQVEIWDLSLSVLDPLVVHLPVTNVQITSVKFALNSKALVVGDSDGHSTIYQLNEINFGTEMKSIAPLLKAIESNLPDKCLDHLSTFEQEGASSGEFIER